MAESTRRTILRRLSLMPVLAGLGKLNFGRDTTPQGSSGKEEFESKFLAVRTLRFINTMQRRIKEETNWYATMSEFKASTPVQKIRDLSTGSQVKGGKTLLGQFRFGESEFVPAWKLNFRVDTDRQAYLAIMTPVAEGLSSAFSTDEGGVIYEGKPVTRELGVARPTRASEAVLDGLPINTGNRVASRCRGLVRAVAFSGAVSDVPQISNS